MVGKVTPQILEKVFKRDKKLKPIKPSVSPAVSKYNGTWQRRDRR